jgi:hypothetical protein
VPGYSGADALDGMMWCCLLANDGYAMANFLWNTAQASLSFTADTIYRWVEGDQLTNTFWAVANIWNFSVGGYGNAITGLVAAQWLGNSYLAISGFLFSKLDYWTALSVLAQLGY